MIISPTATICLSLLWLGGVWVGWVCARNPQRAHDWEEENLPGSFQWSRLFFSEESSRLAYIRFQGVAILVLAFLALLSFGLTLRSTRTPPALSSAPSQLPASSASLSASVQAGPVTFVR